MTSAGVAGIYHPAIPPQGRRAATQLGSHVLDSACRALLGVEPFVPTTDGEEVGIAANFDLQTPDTDDDSVDESQEE